MHSFKSVAAVAAAFALTVQAQYSIDPNSIPLSTRQSWCQMQISSCPLLCLQLSGTSSTTAQDTCDATSLAYSCICGNGLQPNVSEYSQTVPFFICQEYTNQCVTNCGNDNTCQSNCREQNRCGAQDPIRVNVTTTSSAAATATGASGSAESGDVVYNGLGSASTTSAASSSSNSKSGAQSAIDLGRGCSLAVVAAGLFAGFAFVI